MECVGETGTIGEKEVEAISTEAEQASGIESLSPIEKSLDESKQTEKSTGSSKDEPEPKKEAPKAEEAESLDVQKAVGNSVDSVKAAVNDGVQALGHLVSGTKASISQHRWHYY